MLYRYTIILVTKYRITLLALITLTIGLLQTCMIAVAKEPINQPTPELHKELVIQSDDRERRAFLYVPKNLQDKTTAKPAPLVIALHGFGSTAGKIVKDMQWSEKAEKESFIVVYPQGSRAKPKQAANLWKNPQSWNDGAGRFYSGKENVDDVNFIRELISSVSESYSIDSQRIYITGFSNGAAMTFRLGAELSEIVCAIAPSAGSDWNKNIKIPGKLSMIYITGTKDTLNPIDGGIPHIAAAKKRTEVREDDRKKPPVIDSINKWIKALNCSQKAISDLLDNGIRTRIYNAENGNKVKFITIDGHGHAWPGNPVKQPKMIVGNTVDKLNATDMIWQFFETCQK